MKPQDGFTFEQWLAAKPEHFDVEAEYNEHVQPLIAVLHDKCVELGIPFSWMAVVKDGKKITRCRTSLNTGGIHRASVDVLVRATEGSGPEWAMKAMMMFNITADLKEK